MTTATTSVHNITVALHNEVHSSIEADLSKEPSKSLFVLRGSQFKSHIGGLSSAESREVARSAFHAHTSQVSLRRYYYFYEELPSDDALFRLTVIVKRPGMLESIIEGCVDTIRRHMHHHDVDDPPVTIDYAPISIYSVLYPENTANTYFEYIGAEVVARLGVDRIQVSINDYDSFECRRS